MTESRKTQKLAREIHSIICFWGDKEHIECGPDAREHYPVEKVIAEWHLAKIGSLIETAKRVVYKELSHDNAHTSILDLQEVLKEVEEE